MILSLLEKIKKMFSRKQKNTPEVTEVQSSVPVRIKKTCKKCGKTFRVDPTWEHIPNYCKECKQQFAREKEERQRSGEKRKITRKCRNCGKFFTFPSTLPHYPNYCSNCRKQRQTAMKEKYGRPVKRKREEQKA